MINLIMILLLGISAAKASDFQKYSLEVVAPDGEKKLYDVSSVKDADFKITKTKWRCSTTQETNLPPEAIKIGAVRKNLYCGRLGSIVVVPLVCNDTTKNEIHLQLIEGKQIYVITLACE